ncbi:MAG: class I SAM-dependent methyltransferase [Lewinellaceae bacterium]|nr:class I SAM-dependent methyltransferase [Phaeodactylibacter sp.]MCB9350210.1 class I SAM-dependent methyltransferase [Lewinellaceae bacterium]
MRFDEAAATWDESPARQERCRTLANELIPIIQANRLKTGLDFGAATGLLSVYLTDCLEQITLVDVSEGMIHEARRKIEQLGANNIETFCQDILSEPLDRQYGLLYTLMALHHVKDVEGALKAFYGHVRPGGYCCIADLDQEDGSFHAEFPDFDGHNGFDQRELKLLMEQAGFTAVQSHIFYSIEQEGRAYPLFLMVGKKE